MITRSHNISTAACRSDAPSPRKDLGLPSAAGTYPITRRAAVGIAGEVAGQHQGTARPRWGTREGQSQNRRPATSQ